MSFKWFIAIVGFAFLGCRSAAEEHSDRVAELVRSNDYAGLAALTDHPDEDMRSRAAKALSWSRSTLASAGHKKILNDNRLGWRIRTEAAWRLIEEDAPDGFNVVTTALGSESPELRWNMAKLLGQIRDRRALPHLTACKKDANKYVAAWCVWARCRTAREGKCRKPNMNLTNGKPAP